MEEEKTLGFDAAPSQERFTIYHNARCSKSRMAVEYLTEQGKEFEIIEYLKEVPTKEELKSVIAKLGIKAEDLIRKNETDFTENFKGKIMTEEDCIEAMIRFPKLIKRPIVVKNNKAVIARPTNLINDLI